MSYELKNGETVTSYKRTPNLIPLWRGQGEEKDGETVTSYKLQMKNLRKQRKLYKQGNIFPDFLCFLISSIHNS